MSLHGTWIIIKFAVVYKERRLFYMVPKVRGISLWTDGSVIEYVIINRHKYMVITSRFIVYEASWNVLLRCGGYCTLLYFTFVRKQNCPHFMKVEV